MIQFIVFILKKSLSILSLFAITLVVLVTAGTVTKIALKEFHNEDGVIRKSIVHLEQEVGTAEARKRTIEESLASAEKSLKDLQSQKDGINAKISSLADEIKEEQRELSNKMAAESISFPLNDWDGNRDAIFTSKICSAKFMWKKSTCEIVLREAKGHARISTIENWKQLSDLQWQNHVDWALDEHCSGAHWLGDKLSGDWWCTNRKETMKAIVTSIIVSRKLQVEATEKIADYQSLLTRLSGEITNSESDVHIEKSRLEDQNSKLDQLYILRDQARQDPVRVTKMGLHAAWERAKPYFLWAFIIVFMTLFGRPLVYVIFAPIAAMLAGRLRISPLSYGPRIAVRDEERVVSELPMENGVATLRAQAGKRQLNVELEPDESLWVRPDYAVSSYKGKSTMIYGGKKHFITSFVAGLTAMTRFDHDGCSKVVVGPTEPDRSVEYVGAITLHDHPGFVIRPSHVVALRAKPGELKVYSRWFFGLQAWMRFQFRYILVSGTGTLYVRGSGGVYPQAVDSVTQRPEDGQPWHQLHDALIVGWDPSMALTLKRNENWIHVAFLKRDAMFETALEGEGVYLQVQNAAKRGNSDPGGRILEVVFNAIGKVFGL